MIKRIVWHPHGITACRRFTVVQDEALIRGRKTSFVKGLHKTHGTEDSNNPRNSKIRDADPHGSVPFTIPPSPKDIPVAEILEEGTDTSNMVKCTAVKLENQSKIIRQKSYTNLNVSDGCLSPAATKSDVKDLSQVFQKSDKFNTWSVDDYMSWIDGSEPAPPGPRPTSAVNASNVHLGRINTIKGVSVPWNTEAVDLRTTKRLNYCDN